jgi:cell pole-organizing protein PopZ
MSFDTRDIAKDMLDKRDYEFLSQTSKEKQNLQPTVGESIMSESAMYGSRTMSYQKLMDTRLIIKHSKAVMDDMQPGARTRNISALFVENQDGERFKYPFIHLAGARAMQRHVANGGLPYDDLGKSIIQMSEEIAQLKSFSNYVVRNDLMNSDTNSIVERGQQRLEGLREQIKALSKQSHYESYKESFQAQEQAEVPEEVVEDFVEKFTVKNFKEDIKSVFPVLYRLMQEENNIGYDDIVAMTQQEEIVEEEQEEAYDPFAKFEQWAMQLGEESAITSQDPEEQSQAVKELQALVGEHFPAGVDGTNAIESLKGIIEDPQLFKQIKDQAKEDPDGCVRPLVKDWLEKNAPEVVDQLDFGDMVDEPAAAQGGEETAPEEEPQMAADDPDERNKKDDKDDLPFEPDDDASDTDEFGNKIKHRARHLARRGMRQAMDVKELAEFINSFYDKESGTFPKGPEGVCTMVGKKFGEQAEAVARKFVERMAPHQEQGAEELAELGRMRELAGVQSAAQEQISNEEKIDWKSDDVETVKAMGQEFYVKDTPEGKLLLGDDVEGYFYTDHNGAEREGNITFVYNLDTGKFLEFPKDYSDFYGYLKDDEVEDFVKELVDEIKGKMGSNEESISPELEDIRRLSGIAQSLGY